MLAIYPPSFILDFEYLLVYLLVFLLVDKGDGDEYLNKISKLVLKIIVILLPCEVIIANGVWKRSSGVNTTIVTWQPVETSFPAPLWLE